MKRWLLAGVPVLVLAGAAFYLARSDGSEEPTGVAHRLVTVERGTFHLDVTASGVIEPVQRIELPVNEWDRINHRPSCRHPWHLR